MRPAPREPSCVSAWRSRVRGVGSEALLAGLDASSALARCQPRHVPPSRNRDGGWEGSSGRQCERGRRQARAGESGERRPPSPARLGSAHQLPLPARGHRLGQGWSPRETGKDTPTSPESTKERPGHGTGAWQGTCRTRRDKGDRRGPGGRGAGRASWGHGRAPWIEVSRFPIDGTHHSPSPRGRETEGGGRPLLRGRVRPPSGAHRLLSKTPSSCRRQSRVWAPEIARLGRRRARAGPGVCSAASARALLSPRSARDTDTSLLWPLTTSKRCS